MIGSLGATSIAAVGLANKVFFVMTLLVFGIVSGSGILAAQFWGNNDVKNIRKSGAGAASGNRRRACFLYSGSRMPETCDENL